MISLITSIDHWLFTQINSIWVHPYLDIFFPFITDLHRQYTVVYLAFPALLVSCLYAYRGLALKLIIGCLIAFGISDAINHRVYKPYFARQRPSVVLKNAVLRTSVHSGYSFPSNHASNCFAVLVFLSCFTRYRFLLLTFASLVAYSRVYVGAPFPADVIVGALSGTAIALSLVWLIRKIKKQLDASAHARRVRDIRF